VKLSGRTLQVARFFFSGITGDAEMAVCRSCGNQVIFEPHLVAADSMAHCPWHDRGLTGSEIVLHDWNSWKKSIRIFAAPLAFSQKWSILVLRLKKG
jgi:hypothetical protein